MIASHRTDLKLTLPLCFAALLVIGAWLAILLLSQLALMEPVTAPGVQSLADNGDPVLFLASGDSGGAEAHYASARAWVWFCICTNGLGALLIGLWLRAAISLPTPPVRRMPPAAASARGNLIERAVQGRSAAGASTMARRLAAPQAGSRRATGAGAPSNTRPASAEAASALAAGSGDASVRLARVARIIDNLAFQTTLLAVNAAVEAQRGSRLPPHA